MSTRAVFLIATLLGPAAAAQVPAERPMIADTAGIAADTAVAFSRADSLAAAVAARRAAEGAALDSLLAAHPDVLAAHLASFEAARPWWRRWWTLPLAFGIIALTGLGLAIAAFVRAGRAASDIAGLPSDGGPAARTATQAAARADAAVAALSASVTARLADVERTRAAVEAQMTQTSNLMERAERLGLFRDAFAAAVATPSSPAATPDSSSTPEPPAA